MEDEVLENESEGTPSGPHKLPSIGQYIQVQHEIYTGGSGGYINKTYSLTAGTHNVAVGQGATSSHNALCSAGGNTAVDNIIAYGGGGAKGQKNNHAVGGGGTGATANGNNGNYSSLTYSAADKYNGTVAGGASKYNSYGTGGSITISSSSLSYVNGGNGYLKIVVN